MLQRIRKWFSPGPAPQTGPPPRLKIYTAQSGYVYHYYATARGGLEFTFDVSADRKAWMPVAVRLDEAGLREWEKANERVLRDQERYALAKMALFAAFDERETPESMREPVRVSGDQMDEIARTLNL